MTNSDRYSPDDYSAELNADQIDEDVAWHQGADKVKRVAGKRVAKTAPPKETTPKETTPKKTTMKALAQQKLAANSAARRNALATISSQSKPLQFKPLQFKPLQKGAQTAGTGIVWTLLGIGLAACGGGGGGGASNAKKPVISDAGSAALAGANDKLFNPALAGQNNAPTGRDQIRTGVQEDVEAVDDGPQDGTGSVTIPALTPTDRIEMSPGEALSFIDYDDYFIDHNGRDQFTVVGLLIGPNDYKRALTSDDFDADGTLTGDLPNRVGAYTLTLTATPVSGAEGEEETVTITINAQVAPAVVTAGATAGKQTLVGDSSANTFTIDTKASAKGSAKGIADEITGFDLTQDKITFVAEGGKAPAEIFTAIWLKKDGDDLLITTTKTDNANNVLAVVKDVFKDDPFSLNSLVDFDVSFLDGRTTEGRWFDVYLDPALSNDVSGTTRIADGSAEGKHELHGSGTLPLAKTYSFIKINGKYVVFNKDDKDYTTYLKIDIEASDIEGADTIGLRGLSTAQTFRDGTDKIILAGAGTNIFAEADGKGNTILYSTNQGATGTDNVLAVIYKFVADDGNFDLTDFLVQDGQNFTVDVL